MAEVDLNKARSSANIEAGLRQVTETHFRFADLPTELRSMIFSFYFQAHDPLGLWVARGKGTSAGLKKASYNDTIKATPPLLLVNKQLSQEALTVRQKNTHVSIPTTNHQVVQMLFPEPGRRSPRTMLNSNAICQSAAKNIMGYQNLTICIAGLSWGCQVIDNVATFRGLLSALDERIAKATQPLRSLRIYIDEWDVRRKDVANAWSVFYKLLMTDRAVLKQAQFGREPIGLGRMPDNVIWTTQEEFTTAVLAYHTTCELIFMD